MLVVDLHIHTQASDGALTPAQVVERAVAQGLKAIAITDHDIIDGCRPAIEAAADRLEVIPGVEINTEWGSKEVHILGYYIDLADQKFLEELKNLRQVRLDRIVKIVRKLNDIGVKVNLDRVLELAGAGTIGRPHVALAMIENGYVSTIQEAFAGYIGYGAPAYVPRYKLLPEEAVQIILKAGGVPVLAHPGLIGEDELIPHLAAHGLQGLEVYYPEHGPEQIDHYAQKAKEYGLVITGGSDFHGNQADYRGDIGCLAIGYDLVEGLKRARNKRLT